MPAGTGCPALSPATLSTQGSINVLANENRGKPVDFDLCYVQCFTSRAWGQQVGTVTASLVLRWNRVRLGWDSLESVPPKCLSAVLRKVVKSKVYPALWHSHWMRQPSTQPVCSRQPQPQSSAVWAPAIALQNPLWSPGAFKHWLLSQDLLNSTCPVSAEETELLQGKILSPPATSCSLFVPSSATLMAERNVLTCFACSGFGSAPTAPAPSRAGRWAGRSSWGSGRVFCPFDCLKVSSYLARRTGRAGGAVGGITQTIWAQAASRMSWLSRKQYLD